MATSSVNPGLANLLQNLTNVGLPILSSPKALAALQKASPSDIVKLSVQATELEGVNALFGNASGTSGNSGFGGGSTSTDPLLAAFYPSNSASSSTDPLLAALYPNGSSSSSTDPLLAALNPSSSSSTSASALATLEQALSKATPGTSSPAVATAVASYQQSIQSEAAQSLFATSNGTSIFG
jgi:hypothetical protein